MPGVSLCQPAALTLLLIFITFPTFEARREAKEANAKLGLDRSQWGQTNAGMCKDVSNKHFF